MIQLSLKKLLILGVVIVCFSSCSSTKDASEDNFSKIVGARLDKYKECFKVFDDFSSKHDFPVEVEATDYYKSDLDFHRLLVGAGLESESSIMKEQTGVPLFGNRKIVEWKQFQPTETGKKYIYKISSIASNQIAYCFGTPRLLKIDSFTEPQSQMGGPSGSLVSFTYVLEALPDWITKNRETLSAYTHVRTSEGEKQQRMMLVMTNNGWVDAETLSRRPYSMSPMF